MDRLGHKCEITKRLLALAISRGVKYSYNQTLIIEIYSYGKG
jgi:hypothetical protein